MEKKYNHIQVENGKNEKWIDKKFFSTHDVEKKPFTIILPPPNVTGKLHLGHAWDGFLQDTIIRYKKLNGYDVMWVPGMDHAGIATQAKVEEKLLKDGITRYDLGREKFLDQVWLWKEDYASTIRNQWAKLGLAFDYNAERFTMDGGLSSAVSKVFINLYERGIIYRGVRAVNWDPKLQTVLSNIEVNNIETNQTMYYIEYDIENSDEKIAIATVRPETLFADVALAINPNDNKNAKLIGKNIIHPLTGRIMPVIFDDEIIFDKGTGIMKVSAHAKHDIDIINKNNLEIIEVIDKSGKMNSNAMEFAGMDRFEARKKIVEKLKSMNRISKEEKTISAVGYSDRSKAPIEVLVQPQWFIKMDGMSKQILENLDTDNKVKFYPERFENTLRTWMENVHDWCISRQLWWGHRIPAWYKGDEIKVQLDSPDEGWHQDEDVLDTWFSSGLAPFSFLGWPNNTEKLNRYYPTNVLVTGYDIIFFWVARMYFQSLDIMKERPFNDVLIHGLIRDAQGRKMSKSLGNGIDPMEVIENYGADALRWFLLTNSSPGQDIRYSVEKIEAAWNLGNKLWNISRYILEVMEESENNISPADTWINNQLFSLQKSIDNKFDKYDFTIIGKEITKFIMEDFSSWYIEISKTNPNKKFAEGILKKLLVIIHPYMPFITDHIFTMFGEELLNHEMPKMEYIDVKEDISKVINITKKLREFRSEKEISNKDKIHYWLSFKMSNVELQTINKLVNGEIIENQDALIPFGNEKIFVKISEEQKEKESIRIDNHIKFLQNEIKRAEGMLNNEGFVAKAPKEKIEAEKNKLNNFKKELASLQENF